MRRPGLGVRWRITLACTALVALTGLVVVVAVRLALRVGWLPERTAIVIDGGGYREGRADVVSASVPLIVFAVVVVLGVALIGGWFVAGRLLAPVAAIGSAARAATAGSLGHRVGMPGPDDELTRLADTVDDMLARLQDDFERQRRFTANASHELRTPLAVASSMLELARADPHGCDVDLLLARLTEINERSLAVLDGLLVLARAEHIELADDAVDLAAIVRAATDGAATAGAATAGRDDAVTVHVDAPSVVVAGHAALLGQLVGNLLDNARRHNHPGGEVWVRLTTDRDGGVELVVTNTGDELADSTVATLTEPFVRGAGRTRRDRSCGTGLGLAVVASIARLHGARLELAPRVGGGMRVVVGFVAPVDG